MIEPELPWMLGMEANLPSMLLHEFRDRSASGCDIADHMVFLAGLAAQRPKPLIVEFGTGRGNSTCAFLTGLLHSGGHLWSVDIAANHAPSWFLGTGLWSFLQADALGDEPKTWIPHACDIMFVDLDPHSFEQTAAMLDRWMSWVRPGGLALFHDTQWGGGQGVRDALCSWSGAHGVPWVNREGSNGLGVIEVPA